MLLFATSHRSFALLSIGLLVVTVILPEPPAPLVVTITLLTASWPSIVPQLILAVPVAPLNSELGEKTPPANESAGSMLTSLGSSRSTPVIPLGALVSTDAA